MNELFAPCDFTNINGYPHNIPDKTIEKLPSFQGNNAISATSHVKSFNVCIFAAGVTFLASLPGTSFLVPGKSTNLLVLAFLNFGFRFLLKWRLRSIQILQESLLGEIQVV